MPASKFRRVITGLRRRYGPPVPPRANGPFELILWELVGELITDEKRAAVFDVLRRRIGTTPAAIDDVDDETLMEIAALGGMAANNRARRMRDAARLAVAHYDGDVDQVLRLPLPSARRALRRFPGVGEPGADKILMLARAHRVFALESNGVRALLRLGYGAEDANYGRTYRSVLAAVGPELPPDFDGLIGAALLLREHGQEICRRTAPQCEICPVSPLCEFAEARRNVTAQRPHAPTSRSRPPRR